MAFTAARVQRRAKQIETRREQSIGSEIMKETAIEIVTTIESGDEIVK